MKDEGLLVNAGHIEEAECGGRLSDKRLVRINQKVKSLGQYATNLVTRTNCVFLLRAFFVPFSCLIGIFSALSFPLVGPVIVPCSFNPYPFFVPSLCHPLYFRSTLTTLDKT